MGKEFPDFFFQTEDWPALVIALGGVGSESGASEAFHRHGLCLTSPVSRALREDGP